MVDMQVNYQQHSSLQQLAIPGLQNNVASFREELALANRKIDVFKTLDADVTYSATRRRLYAAVDQSGREDGSKKRPRIKDAPDTAPSEKG